MTTEHEASRTLVKSPPELWAECSDAGSLARHLGEFGEITITRLEPETTVAWEGEHASGTVRIEPSGWGTRVTLTAHTRADATEVEPEPPPEIEPIEAVPVAAEPIETPTGEEERDAKVEETLEDADPVPVADTGRGRARWRRITARMRGLFGTGAPDYDALEEILAPAAAEPLAPDPAPEPEPELEPEAVVQPQPNPEPNIPAESEPQLDAGSILTSALESLGQAHHRPFSRA